jgi:hypothetical protein
MVLEPSGDAPPGIADLPHGDRVGGRISRLLQLLVLVLGISSRLGNAAGFTYRISIRSTSRT